VTKVYLAGPMRGIPEFNFPAFAAATAQLRALGYEVFSPAEKDIEKHGADINKSATGNLDDIKATGFNLRKTLLLDLTWIAENADAVVVLPGWENSKGANAEVALARAINLIEFPCRVLTLEQALALPPAQAN
jgi:Domain of unknown function (DUF4406)